MGERDGGEGGRVASRTAVLVAGYRARATRAGHGGCDDPWAAALAGEEGEALTRQMDRLQPHMELWLAVRTAWLDQRVGYLTGPACRLPQVVILGAGLDTRAARLRREGIRFFEVDLPASQRDKRARLADLDGYPVDAATYVGCDFEREDFLDRLVASGFRADLPAVVVWEGVTYYLGEAAVRSTLARIATACHPRTTVLFDFVGRRMAEGSARHADDRATRDLVAGLGEPFQWGTNDILPLLWELGFRRFHETRFDEAGLNLTGTYDRDRKWRFQWLAEAGREAPESPVEAGS